MRAIKMLFMGIVVVSLLSCLPSSCALNESVSDQPADAILFIYGGFGVHFTIINDGNETLQAYYDIFGEGFYVNTSWHKHGSFTAGPDVWTTAPPVFIPFSVMPISAYLYFNQNTMLVRRGISFFGWVFFTM